MLDKSQKEGADRPTVFFTCIALYALTSLAICGGVMYLILCVPEGKILSSGKASVDKPLEFNSILISPQELDTPVASSEAPASASDDDVEVEHHIRIIDESQNPIIISDTVEDLNKPRNPKQETLVLDLQDQPDQPEKSAEEIIGDNFYQK